MKKGISKSNTLGGFWTEAREVGTYVAMFLCVITLACDHGT